MQLFLNKHAISQAWAQRMLMYPNMLLAIVALVGTFALYQAVSTHSETSFAITMNLLDGTMILMISLMEYNIVKNPLSEGLKYGWEFLFRATIPASLILLVVSWIEQQWWVAYFAALKGILSLIGIFEVRKIAKREPYKF